MPDSNIVRLPTEKYGVGQPVPRQEDPTLLRGQGRYTDDMNLPGQAYAAVVRSTMAHGHLRGIDTETARAMPGVLMVLTADDLTDYGPMKCAVPMKNRDGSGIAIPPRPSLATGRVRFVGDPIAVVVAETATQARDAAEAVMPDIDALPAVTSSREAAAKDAPLLFDEVDTNIALDFHHGDAAAVQAAFDSAAHVARASLTNNRIVVAPMEPRAALASWDAAEERFTLRVGSQGVFGLRNQMADILKVEPKKLRILTGNVGGSFGMKASAYPEYVPILHAARVLGRPVKWTDDRSGAFVSDQHGRDHDIDAELALDGEGKFLAIRLTAWSNMGGYLATVGPMMATLNLVKNTPSLYATGLIEVSTLCVMTNTSPVSAYRGAGRPEGNYVMERLVEAAAKVTGIDALELRRRNQIAPTQIPFRAASGLDYDSGDFPAVLADALKAADWDGFAAREAESRRRGKLRGRGLGAYLEVTGPPAKEQGGIRFGADGTVTIITGTLDYGQGHWTPFAQVLCDRLGVPFEAVRLLQGDSDELVAGGGTGGSKSIMASGAAIIEASVKVVEKGRAAAAMLLEAAEVDIEFANGRFSIAGTDRGIGIMDLSAAKLPDGTKVDLDVRHVFDEAPSAFPNGCHVAEVEVDPDTGTVAVVRYTMANDFGVVVNPLLVAGQAHGGVVQGIGQALFERTVYDETGQFLTGSFMDYALPRANDVPSFDIVFHSVPATTNPLGAKGCGEAGCAGSLPSVMNALNDALRRAGAAEVNMPATPEVVWRALVDAKAA